MLEKISFVNLGLNTLLIVVTICAVLKAHWSELGFILKIIGLSRVRS